MQVAGYNDQKTWNNFVAGQKQAQFLHSWEWGDLQEKEGREVHRLAIIEDSKDKIKGAFFLIKCRLLNNYNYFYTPRGPIFAEGYNNAECWDRIIDKIKELAKKDNVIFWRYEPVLPLPEKVNLKEEKVAPVQPKNTLILNLEDSEEDILKKMHPKTRYNIKLAQKKGIQISSEENIEKSIDIFWQLLNTTAKRQDFVLHNRDHYKNIAESKLGYKLYFAHYGGNNIAANMNVNFGDTSIYLHGASSDEFRNLKPTSLLQWEAIKEAKKKGYRYYDFWGINANKCLISTEKCQKWDCKPGWIGITRFKIGYGGEEINYPGAFDMPINHAIYNLYKIYKKFRIKN